ncbi:DUF4367 domain-containing protein [Paenibacillus alba]|nr:DUF4367 domain-containing protein [Paenibacillus alba]
MDGDNVHKERIFNRLKYKMETGKIQLFDLQKDGISMKKNSWKSIAVAAAALVCVGGVFSTTSYAQDMIHTIMARFQVGNMEITQYDKELPVSKVGDPSPESAKETERIEREAPPAMTLDKAREVMGIDFPAPTWLSDTYTFMNVVSQGKSMVEVQYEEKDKNLISLLISKGANNGISTTDEVKTETIKGTKVYYANGIVIWEYKGFTYELYSGIDFDVEAMSKIIGSLSTKGK